MHDITRYDVDTHGELPLSYGRYVRYEDYDEHVQQLLKEIDTLEHELRGKDTSYSNGYEDGHDDGFQWGKREGLAKLEEFRETLKEITESLLG
jgi:flagellar biosynthesis/type III secretory pathway protein FliH